MDKKIKTIGFIFARGGSKGVKDKNIRMLAGKPLICYSIEAALKSRKIDRVVVSTDDQKIADIAEKAGAEIPFLRPSQLAQDDSPEWLSWQHAIEYFRKNNRDFDLFAAIPATAPLRQVSDIDNCIALLLENEDADAAITVCKAQRHPSFNMVVLDENRNAKIAVPDSKTISRRQDASVMYDMTTVAYAARPGFILDAGSLFDGRVRALVVPVERALDIDTEFDFKLARLIIEDSRKQ